MDYSALRSLINARPEFSGWLASGAMDSAIVASVNSRTLRGPVPIREVSAIALESGLYGHCEVQIRRPVTQESEPIHRLAFDTLTLLRDDYRLETADVDTARFQAGLAASVGLGWLAQDAADAITSLGENRVSPAERDLGRAITEEDVRAARNEVA